MSSSSISEDESVTERTPRSNASSSLISSCRKLAAEKPPLESVSVDSSSARLSVDSGGAESRRKTMSKHGNRGVAKSCKMLVGMQSEGPDRDAERRSANRGDGDAGDGEEAGGYLGLRHFLGRLSSSDERTDEGQERQDAAFAVKESKRYAANSNDTVTDRGDNDNTQNNLTNPNNGYHRDLLVNSANYKHVNGSQSTRHETVRESNDPTAEASGSGKLIPHGAQLSGVFSDDENGEAFDDDVELKQPTRERISYTKRKIANDYDNSANEQYMTLPASTHTLLHTEPIFSVAFLFSLGIAVLSASCLLLVLVNEMSEGQGGNLLDVPTGVSSGVRGAQFCGIFVGLLMEEEIPQGLILLRSISRASFRATYPELSFTRFVLSCLLRLVMGYLFLLNLFVTIVQADDVISIFFDILALEFVQHLDDMAFDLGRKDMLGRSLNVATMVEYNVLTREGLKQAKKRNDEKNALIRHDNKQKQEENSNAERTSIFHFICRRKKKKVRFRWILKAAYFINLAGLLTSTIIVGENQKKGHYHCKSVSVMFGDEVWQNAYVTNWTDPSQAPQKETLVYSYFNGVYRITDTDNRGYPVYTEMNKISGDAYLDTVGAEIVYCQAEEAWVFRHQYISKVDIFGDEEDECLQWLLRSPQTNVYDLIDVQHDDWSVWTGIITPGNKVSILCNVCNHNSDCNYHGECGQDGECYCNPGYYGVHCEFEEFCDKLIDDEGEVYTLITDTKNKTLLSYMRPIYASRPLNLFEMSQNTSSDKDINDEKDTTANNSTDYDVLLAEETNSDNATSPHASTSAATSCYPEAQKVRLESTTGEQIAMFELQAYSSGTNVALRGTASQSSDRNNGEILDASRAIDGINTTFSHTDDTNAMWEVDLGGLYPIQSLLVVNRYCGNISADPLGCLCRLSNATVTLLDETESIVAMKTIGNTCGQLTVSESFTPNYTCPHTLSVTSTGANAKKSTTSLNEVTDATNTTEVNSTLDEAMDDWFPDVQVWGTVVLVYSGSRWFGTIEYSLDEVLESSNLIYNADYHAFWDKLYEGRTFFISDPTSGATPVGTDFYENQLYGEAQWDDYGPFGLLTPLNNITGKGYFHCMGTNISAVKVASGTGDYGE